MSAHRHQTTVISLQSEIVFLWQSLTGCISYVPKRQHGWQDQSIKQKWKLEKYGE